MMHVTQMKYRRLPASKSSGSNVRNRPLLPFTTIGGSERPRAKLQADRRQQRFVLEGSR